MGGKCCQAGYFDREVWGGGAEIIFGSKLVGRDSTVRNFWRREERGGRMEWVVQAGEW